MITALLQKMTIQEKIGQMCLVPGSGGKISKELSTAVADGRIGAILNEVDTEVINQLQRIAVTTSRLGIPLLIGRDVIHGFRTIFPIPLGLAATWNPELVETCCRIAAVEAASVGINWTFAPMLDIARDPRWGRIAESCGEDPYLTCILAAAMVRGYQGDDLARPGALAACAKHFAGYGAAEGGRDYNTTILSEDILRNLYLPPFKAALAAGVVTFMAGFHEVNGIPVAANEFFLQQILRQEWGYNGLVVSDWQAIQELIPHGLCANEKEAALAAITAGVDMEMVSTTYASHLEELVLEGQISETCLNNVVRRILQLKLNLGLFDNPYTAPAQYPEPISEQNLALAKLAARQSIVLLKNNAILPLSRAIRKLAIIGPLADDPHNQLGTWVFDKRNEDSQTPLQSIRQFRDYATEIFYAKGLETGRARDTGGFAEAVKIAKKSEVVLLFLGEESILSGEAHSRANIDLPGAQEQLVTEIAGIGKPIILVLMAGRPLTLVNIIDKVAAILYAWHPGTMAGPALVDLIFGIESPSGKLPVTLPRHVGQVPIYYNHKNTGRPHQRENWVHIDAIPADATQTSLGNRSNYLDVDLTPLYPFGYGLSYTQFVYQNLQLSSDKIQTGESIRISADIYNAGNYPADEIVQLYLRDLVASVTRPVKELKGFQRIRLEPGESRRVTFEILSHDLAFYNRHGKLVTEPGRFHVWIGRNSQEGLPGEFEVTGG